VPQNGWLLPWSFVYQPLWQPIFPGKTIHRVQISNLYSLHSALISVSLIICHRTADHILSLFFKMLSSVEWVSPYHLPLLLFDFTEAYWFKLCVYVWALLFIAIDKVFSSCSLATWHNTWWKKNLLDWKEVPVSCDGHSSLAKIWKGLGFQLIKSYYGQS
jgi:hypothetical protein